MKKIYLRQKAIELKEDDKFNNLFIKINKYIGILKNNLKIIEII